MLIVKHSVHRVLGWAGLAFFIYISWVTWRAGDRRSFLVALGFAALACYFLLNVGSTHVDSDSIRYYLPLRSYRIKWSEVRYIETDVEGASLVFVGDNKRLSMNGPRLWAGKDKMAMRKLMDVQVKRYGIEIRHTQKAVFRRSRNTRVQ